MLILIDMLRMYKQRFILTALGMVLVVVIVLILYLKFRR
jgi:hypothetical protein